MKVLFGVQGTGNGHISRARALNKYLKACGVDVDYIFSGRERDKYFDMEEFGDWQCYRGLTFVHDSGNVKIFRTFQEASLRQLWKDIRTLDVSGYDLVITDFEPVTAWAARRAGKTCLGIGHQYAFKYDVPRRGDSFVGKKIMDYFAPVAESLGLHWHHFNQPILPPIVDIDHINDPVDEKKILVYLGFEEADDVIQLLEPFKEYTFAYYGPFPEYESLGHIKLKPLSRDGFKYDLATSAGVICNAGFELSSEALHMGKKLLVKPLLGQLEQLSNAEAMQQLDLAMTMDFLDSRIVSKWLNEFSGRHVNYPNVAKAIAEWIAQRGWQDASKKEQLIQQLWQAVEVKDVQSFIKNSTPYAFAKSA
ncbi:uncharacterized protein (TIGR00661 family) [Alteromonadaceae bacterium 2753L.S.0a.02]|nr:uncharacterized protein (TIGR00661 family) [Alteromonadaceae bacterium 2753L.S.0a.02]